jgi:transcriptional regulator with XRE-family HTH domain
MSYFGAKLAELLERRNLRAAEVCRASGIKEAMLSRWVNDTQNFVSLDDLGALCEAISDDPKEQAELIRAHLLDECPPKQKATKLIDVRILSEQGGRALHTDTTVYRVPLTPKLQRAFDVLMEEAVADADVRDVLLGMASILDRDLEQSDDTNSAVDAAGKLIAADALGSAAAGVEPKPPTGPVRYKVPRRSKKKRRGGDAAT